MKSFLIYGYLNFVRLSDEINTQMGGKHEVQQLDLAEIAHYFSLVPFIPFTLFRW